MDFPAIFKEIRQRNLKELAAHDKLVAEPADKPHLPRGGVDDIVKWTNDSQEQIQAAITNRVFGGEVGSPIDFNNAFMAFMESAAMYRRKTSVVMQAIDAYRKDDKKLADELLEQSTADIDKLANMWGMNFVVICDLVEKHPDGRSLMVGPYCGAFVSKDLSFIGVAFKGTSLPAEVVNDLLAALTLRVPEQFLFAGQISEGFYYPMFSTYSQKPSTEPYALVKQAIEGISSLASTTMVTHVTGHSLGAAYASLCYAQLTIDGTGTTKAVLGDLYTFGSPRVGRGDFAKPFKAAVATPCGSAWRIVNRGDYVTKVPASPPFSAEVLKNPFIHVDMSYTISKDAKPKLARSEIGTHPTWRIPTSISAHFTGHYYKSLKYATTGRRLSAFEDLQMDIDALGGIDYFTAAASNPMDRRLMESVKPQDLAVVSTQCTFSIDGVDQCALGTLKVGSLVGKIMAWGDATGIDAHSVTLYCDSLKALCGVNMQCVIRATGETNTKEANIVFVADGVVAALAALVMKSEVKAVHLDGTCMWEFDDTPIVEQISDEWTKATEVAFEKLFTTA